MPTPKFIRVARWRPALGVALIALAPAVGCSLFDRAPAEVDAGSGPVAPSPSDVPESEPNDDVGRAHDLSLGVTRAGAVATGDADFYRLLGGAEPARVDVTAVAALEVEVITPRDGASYVVSVAPGETVSVLKSLRQTPAIVAVRGTGTYRLTATAVDPSEPICGFGLEPDSAARAGVVFGAIPSRVDGCIAVAGDEDHIVVPRAALAEVGAFGVFVSGVPNVSLDVRVEDSAGNELAAMSGGPGRQVGVPSIAVPLEGDVRIRVRSLAGANETQPYALELRRVPLLNGIVEAEPNDRPDFASVVGVVDLVNGYLHRPGDVDYYRLQTPEPRVLRLYADSPTGVDLQLFLDAGTLFGPATIDETGMGEREGICSLRVGPDMPFTFGVRARSAAQEDFEPYLVHFEFYEGTDFEVEPNNAPLDLPQGDDLLIPENQPVGLWLRDSQLGLSAAGHLFPPGDNDFFVVEVFADPRSQVTYTSVTLRLEPNGTADYVLELLDADSGVLARSATGGPGEFETVSVDLPGGRYFARVTMVAGETCEAPYRLSVAQTEIPANAQVVEPLPMDGSGEVGDGTGVEAMGPGTIVIENAVIETRPEGLGAGDGPVRRPPPRPPTMGPAPTRASDQPGTAPAVDPGTEGGQGQEFWPGR